MTGGAGFIGSHLCRRLLAEGYEVIAFDNLLTGRGQHGPLLGHARFSFVHYDVTNYLHVEGPLDAILHFASPATPVDYRAAADPDPEGRLARHAQGARPRQGEGRALPAREHLRGATATRRSPAAGELLGQRQPDRPARVYDEAKRFAEAITMAYHRAHGVDTRIVRIFNTYGPRMRLDDGARSRTSSARRCAASR